MPSIRGGYGYGLYNSGEFGTEGILQESSASLSASSTVAADGYITKQDSASTAVASTSTSSATVTFASGATVASTTVTASVAEQFVLKESDKFSYGSGAYGYNAFDQEDLQTISAGTSVVANVAGIRVQSSGASVSVSASTAADSEKIFQGEIQISPQATSQATGAFTVAASGASSVLGTITINYIRERNTDGQVTVSSTISASAREMWEPISVSTHSWVELTETATQWQEIA